MITFVWKGWARILYKITAEHARSRDLNSFKLLRWTGLYDYSLGLYTYSMILVASKFICILAQTYWIVPLILGHRWTKVGICGHKWKSCVDVAMHISSSTIFCLRKRFDLWIQENRVSFQGNIYIYIIIFI